MSRRFEDQLADAKQRLAAAKAALAEFDASPDGQAFAVWQVQLDSADAVRVDASAALTESKRSVSIRLGFSDGTRGWSRAFTDEVGRLIGWPYEDQDGLNIPGKEHGIFYVALLVISSRAIESDPAVQEDTKVSKRAWQRYQTVRQAIPSEIERRRFDFEKAIRKARGGVQQAEGALAYYRAYGSKEQHEEDEALCVRRRGDGAALVLVHALPVQPFAGTDARAKLQALIDGEVEFKWPLGGAQ